MADPLGLIGDSGGIRPPFNRIISSGDSSDGPSFKDALIEQINKVNELQKSADRAIEDFATHERDDIEGVMLATLEADTAFKMLLQVRNKVMDAYEEVKQIRV